MCAFPFFVVCCVPAWSFCCVVVGRCCSKHTRTLARRCICQGLLKTWHPGQHARTCTCAPPSNSQQHQQHQQRRRQDDDDDDNNTPYQQRIVHTNSTTGGDHWCWHNCRSSCKSHAIPRQRRYQQYNVCGAKSAHGCKLHDIRAAPSGKGARP